MWKSNIINIKWITVYILCSLSFGASVSEVVAIEVARNIYLEKGDLHNREEFFISSVEFSLFYLVEKHILNPNRFLDLTQQPK